MEKESGTVRFVREVKNSGEKGMILKDIRKTTCELVKLQLRNIFGLDADIEEYADDVFRRIKNCFVPSADKYYSTNNQISFSPYHSGQYTIFLYYLSNQIWKDSKDAELASAVYYLNKSLNAVDLFYEVELPNIFGLEHPLGSVMGRAKYSDYFFFNQNCTVGGTFIEKTPVYPKLGEFILLNANCSILGNCKIGNYVILGAGTIIKDEDIPDNSLVFGLSPNLIIKRKTNEYIKDLLKINWNNIK